MIVMGPTPPGTGVICPATSNASLYSHHHTFDVLISDGSSLKLTPTSITHAPGLIQSA